MSILSRCSRQREQSTSRCDVPLRIPLALPAVERTLLLLLLPFAGVCQLVLALSADAAGLAPGRCAAAGCCCCCCARDPGAAAAAARCGTGAGAGLVPGTPGTRLAADAACAAATCAAAAACVPRALPASRRAGVAAAGSCGVSSSHLNAAFLGDAWKVPPRIACSPARCTSATVSLSGSAQKTDQ